MKGFFLLSFLDLLKHLIEIHSIISRHYNSIEITYCFGMRFNISNTKVQYF